MPQQEKITRKLDLDKRAAFTGLPWKAKAANYTVLTTESGYTYAAKMANYDAAIKFTLPLANACNGSFWNFVQQNCAKLIISGTKTNSIIVPGISVNYNHGVTALNIGLGVNRTGAMVTVFSDGSWYWARQVGSIANANALFYNVLFED